MCVSPSFVWLERAGQNVKQAIPCRVCWRCQANRVNDYVGRCLAEASTSDWTCVLTLTYRPPDKDTVDPLAHQILTPAHHNTFIRSIRDSHRKKKSVFSNREHTIRFLTVGEYGSLKGRAHFHTILFGKGEPPEVPHKQNVHIKSWPHGHVFADWDADEKAIRYAVKYLLKNEKGKFYKTQSRYPPLGAEFFQRKAQECIYLGVFPSTFLYQPPNGSTGRPYMMTGAIKRDYLATVMKGLAHKLGYKNKRKFNPYVWEALEKVSLWELKRAASYANLEGWLQTVLDDLDEKRLDEMQVKYQIFQQDEQGKQWQGVDHVTVEQPNGQFKRFKRRGRPPVPPKDQQ